ncbi:hypothetical protein B0H11DRAFT_1964718 [Mycena galericulata]|nr:hypothetical protein B0H11DRAFT_1964718 [Mycena galericulata]
MRELIFLTLRALFFVWLACTISTLFPIHSLTSLVTARVSCLFSCVARVFFFFGLHYFDSLSHPLLRYVS